MTTFESIHRLPYMGEALHKPNNCPKTVSLVNSLLEKTQAPVDMVLMSVLSSYSMLLQGIIDVERPEVGRGPVSLFTLTIAESGERKSTVSNLLERPVVDFQLSENEKYKERIAEYELELEIHEEEVAYLRRLISKELRRRD